MKKVRYFVVGAPRAGTTSLFEILKKASNICLPIAKEPNYFCKDVQLRWQRYGNTDADVIDWRNQKLPDAPGKFHTAAIENLEQYNCLFKRCDKNLYKMDFSTNYLGSLDAPRAISEYNSEAKIIMMLRDPFERAWSHYNMDKRIGYHSETFDNCLKEEHAALKRGDDCRFSYIRDSSYADAYKRYRNFFSDSSIMIVDFDKFIINQTEAVKKICDFIKIPPIALSDTVVVNPARNVRFGIFFSLLTNIRLKKRIRNLLPVYANSVLKRILYKKERKKIPSRDKYEIYFADQDIRGDFQ